MTTQKRCRSCDKPATVLAEGACNMEYWRGYYCDEHKPKEESGSALSVSWYTKVTPLEEPHDHPE